MYGNTLDAGAGDINAQNAEKINTQIILFLGSNTKYCVHTIINDINSMYN